MNLIDLLRGKDIPLQQVLVLRHRPKEPELRRILPWLAAEKPDTFNAYQQSQTETVENAITRAQYVASFIGHEPGKALFVGLYSVNGWKQITHKQFWRIPANVELRKFGSKEFMQESPRSSILWFDLVLMSSFYSDWKGKLIVGWPGPERAWHRWAHKPENGMSVLAILNDSAFDGAMPEWNQIDFSWEELSVLPTKWKSILSQWRGIYYIFDTSDGKGYVGAAYGNMNLLGRWKGYAAHGHGGNRLLRQRDPRHFRFTILQRVSPDMDVGDVVRLETTWKERLHTRQPHGLNDN
jgi:hypothetical protein